MIRRIALIFIIAILVIPGCVFAQQANHDSLMVPSAQSFAPSMMGIIAKLVISLILIVGLIYASMFFLKKINARASGGGTVGDIIKIVGRTFLSPKQCLYLVKIGEKYMVLGATEGSINLIDHISQAEFEELKKNNIKANDVNPQSKFAMMLKGIVRP